MASLMDILAGAGNLLDLPGSSLRDLLSGRNPFDQWTTPFSDVNRASGRDVLQPFLGANEETGMAGWATNPMEGLKDIAGFGAEMLLDPLNLVPLGAVGKALKGRKAARQANAAMKAERGGKYALVNPKVAGRVMSEAAPIADNPMRLLGYTPAPENPMFPGVEIMHHGGRDMSASATKEHPYGIFDLGRLKTGEGNNMFSPGAYKADADSTSSFYKDMIQDDLDEKFYRSEEALAKYFEPGRTLFQGYGGDRVDRVLEFSPNSEGQNWSGWSVKVQGMEEGADGVYRAAGNPRWHATQPEMSDMRKFLGENPNKARLYSFDAPAGTKDRFLKWENPMSEQPQAVQDLMGDPSKFFNPEQLDLMSQAREANLRWTQATDKLAEFNDGRYLQANELVGNTLKEKAASLKAARKQAELDVVSAQQQYQLLKNKLLDQNVPYDIATGRFKDLSEMDGEAAVELLLGAKPSEASLADTVRMRDAGIPGVKNLANSTGRSTYNYAIWDQNLLNKMRVRMIDGVRQPINPTTLVEQVQQPVARAADSPLTSTMNPMQLQPETSPFPAAVAGAVYNALQAFNGRGGIQ